jgi:hypothetical protein
MTLSLIQSGKQSEPFRMLVHGTEGIGKSTFASKAPDPIFVQTEDGLGQLDAPRFPLAENWDNVTDCLATLLKEKHSYGTLCIDSVDWLEKLAVLKILADFKGKTTLADFDYGKGYAIRDTDYVDRMPTNDAPSNSPCNTRGRTAFRAVKSLTSSASMIKQLKLYEKNLQTKKKDSATNLSLKNRQVRKFRT